MENKFVNSDMLLDLIEFSVLKSTKKKNLKTSAVAEGITKTIVKLAEKNEYNKPAGEYITFDVSTEDANIKSLIENMSKELIRLSKNHKSILIIGIGNDILVSDSLGPTVVKKLDIDGSSKIKMYKLCPNVVGNTGIDSTTIIKSVIDIVKPDLIIAVDSLASRNFSRVGRSFQISTGGIVPGSGSGKKNPEELSIGTLGVPVIAIGLPIVVHVKSVIYECLDGLTGDENLWAIINSLPKINMLNGVIMAPKEVDYIVDNCSKIIATAIDSLL